MLRVAALSVALFALAGTPAVAETIVFPLTVTPLFGGGAAASFLHTADSSLMQPAGGNWAQHTSGSAIAVVTDDGGVMLATLDLAPGGDPTVIDAGDTLTFAGTRAIHAFTGSLDAPVIGAKVGDLAMSADLVLGPTVEAGIAQAAPGADFAIDGTIEYTLTFTDTWAGYAAGTVLAGTFYFQSAHWAGPFNGLTLIPDGGGTDLELAVWGSNEGPPPAGPTTLSVSPTLGIDLFLTSDLGVVEPPVSTPVPEPTPAWVWGPLSGAAVAGLWLRRR